MSFRTRLKSWRASTLLSAIILVATPGFLLGQDPEPSPGAFTISGTVLDAEGGMPLQYAVVGIPELRTWDLSEADGSYSLDFAEPGVYHLVVVKRGYYLVDQDVTFAGPNEIAIELFKEDESSPVGPGRLLGRVREQGSEDPINRAKVRITPTGQEATTDRLGRFIISDISSGPFIVEVEAEGQTALTDTLVALPGVTVAVEVLLPTRPGEESSVTTEVWPYHLEATGFYRRAEGSRGRQVGRTYIEESNAFTISDVIERVPGIQAETGRFGGTILSIRDPLGRGRCALGVYLDNSSMPGFDVDNYPLEWVEALEVYEGMDVPPQFPHSCGVILIWSRRVE